MHQPPSCLRDFRSLVEIMTILQGPGGCPWDQEQDHKTIAPCAVEEAHELVEAIEGGQDQNIVEELGDLLLQVVFHAELGRRSGRFTIDDIVESICDKMVRRHPHVFGDVAVANSKEVLTNWSKIKESEKKGAPSDSKDKSHKTRAFNIPVNLPALHRAHKIGEKTHQLKFDWPDVEGVFAKLQEELGELSEVVKSESVHEQEHELGDVLFTVAQIARHLKVNAEQSLRLTNARFENRYEQMMKIVSEKGLNWSLLSDVEKENLWQEAKRRSQR